MDRKRKRSFEIDLELPVQKKKTNIGIDTLQTDDKSYTQRHNNVEYYIKGQHLDTDDTEIMRNFNHIYFYSSITRQSAAKLVKLLLSIEHENIEDMHKNGTDTLRPIYLHLLCEGGDIFSALSIYQNIQQLKSPVHGYVNGFISSAAIIILLACNEKIMDKTSFLGIHSIKMVVWGKLQFLQQCNNNFKKVWESLEKLYEEKTKLKQNKINIKKFMTEAQLLDAEQAKQYGFIDKIIG